VTTTVLQTGADVVTAAAGELAHSGANGQVALLIAGIAVAVLVIGGVVLLVLRRRNRSR
jgi:LPXTG-motif cell wall-anchored protein